jgi:hypothetical protein
MYLKAYSYLSMLCLSFSYSQIEVRLNPLGTPAIRGLLHQPPPPPIGNNSDDYEKLSWRS